jgi:Flp pilus assembly protein TadB
MQVLLDKHWHHIPVEQAVELLETDLGRGLDLFELKHRQERFGPNVLTPRRAKSPLMRFLLQFNNPLIYILLVASVITALVKDLVDALIILGVVLVNAIIGFIQESKAEEAIEALAQTMTTKATVLRAGRTEHIAAAALVPGDVVTIKAGDKVPADLRLVRTRNLQIAEASLTGESVPIQKVADTSLAPDTPLAERRNMAYASTLVTYGQGVGIVTATGDNTEVGLISQLISSAEELATPLTRKIAQFSQKAQPAWYIGWAAFGILLATSALVVWRTEGTLLRWIVRELALLGYIAVFLAIVSSHYKREVTKIFGRSFVNAHHILSVTGAVLLTMHPIGVAWDLLSAAVFIPVFHPVEDLFRNGGRIAWYVFAVGALTAVWRKRVGSRSFHKSVVRGQGLAFRRGSSEQDGQVPQVVRTSGGDGPHCHDGPHRLPFDGGTGLDHHPGYDHAADHPAADRRATGDLWILLADLDRHRVAGDDPGLPGGARGARGGSAGGGPDRRCPQGDHSRTQRGGEFDPVRHCSPDPGTGRGLFTGAPRPLDQVWPCGPGAR